MFAVKTMILPSIAPDNINSGLSILKWAAGAPIELPENVEVAEEKVFNLLIYHSLVPRFLYRFIEERPDWLSKLLRGYPRWCSSDLIDSLLKYRFDLKQQMQQQMQALNEMSSHWLGGGDPIILIKGFANYALTGQSRFLRAGGDMDLFIGNCKDFTDLLFKLGYEGTVDNVEREVTDERFVAHEYAIVSRGAIKIEVHYHFGVSTYPTWVLKHKLLPSCHPSHWVLPPSQLENRDGRILYCDLLQNSMCGVTPDANGFTIPDVNMSILILCAHIFGHSIGANFWRVRLVELADIVDLVKHPDFDPDKFSLLISQFNAYDSVNATNYLIESYFGSAYRNTIPSCNNHNTLVNLPIKLTYYGIWVAPYSPDDMLIPLQDRPIIEMLMTNTVIASHNENPVIYTLLGENTYNQLNEKPRAVIGRSIIESMRDPYFPLDFSIKWTEAGLAFEMFVIEPPRSDENYLVQIHHDPVDASLFTEVSVDIEGNMLFSLGPSNSCSVKEGGYLFNTLLPWKKNPNLTQKQCYIPILLCFVKQDKRKLPNKVAVIPLKVINYSLSECV